MHQSPYILRSSIYSKIPPLTDPHIVLQRADEVNTAFRMLNDTQISTLVLIGDSGAGKSTLAALLYRRLEMAMQAGQAHIQHLVWLSLGSNTTLPDVIAEILREIESVDEGSSDFFMQKSEEQIGLLVQALCRPAESSFVVLDQFEELYDIENSKEKVGRGAVPLFLNMLQSNLGGSKVVLTSRISPFNKQNAADTCVRTNLITRISIPEGVALLQQRGVKGSPEELSFIWQRCAGHIFALILFSVLITLSGFSLSYLLNSPDYAPMWNGDVTLNLIGSVIHFLNPIQRIILRTLCLFNEPIPVDGLIIATTGQHHSALGRSTFERELGALTEFALVQHYPEDNGNSNYFLHQLVRHYIKEHYLDGSDRLDRGDLTNALGVTVEPNPILANPEARDVALAAGHLRVAAYYAYVAQRYCPLSNERQGLRDVEPLIAIAQHLCLGWHWQQAYDLLSYKKLDENLMRWGAWNTLIQLYTAMVPPLGIVCRRDEGQIFSQLGLLYGRLGDYKQSMFYFEQAIATEEEIGDLQGEGVTLANQGEILRSMGEMQQAHAIFERALLLNKQAYNAHLECVVLHNLGLLYQNEKNYQRAWNYYQKAFKLAQSLQERANSGIILTNMGMLLFDQGQLQESLALLLPALQIRQSLQDRTARSLVLFLDTLEQMMGREAFVRLRQEALGREAEVLAMVGASQSI
ncbi:MAG TPA: tetratricopeptide repeat protein [Ktedonobacteraceae bacterium]|nr:tetratricopeptide repeat protein [Ktedonobacteraceae bacterium]